jgi:hypothetical protein
MAVKCALPMLFRWSCNMAPDLRDYRSSKCDIGYEMAVHYTGITGSVTSPSLNQENGLFLLHMQPVSAILHRG